MTGDCEMLQFLSIMITLFVVSLNFARVIGTKTNYTSTLDSTSSGSLLHHPCLRFVEASSFQLCQINNQCVT